MRPGAKTLLDDTRASWLKLREQRDFTDIEIQFLPIARKDDLGMDALIEGSILCTFYPVILIHYQLLLLPLRFLDKSIFQKITIPA